MGVCRWSGTAKQWHSVSVNIEEYLQNLLMKQTIIGNVGALREEVVTRS